MLVTWGAGFIGANFSISRAIPASTDRCRSRAFHLRSSRWEIAERWAKAERAMFSRAQPVRGCTRSRSHLQLRQADV